MVHIIHTTYLGGHPPSPPLGVNDEMAILWLDRLGQPPAGAKQTCGDHSYTGIRKIKLSIVLGLGRHVLTILSLRYDK